MNLLIVGINQGHTANILKAMDFDADWEFTPDIYATVHGAVIPNKQYDKVWIFGYDPDDERLNLWIKNHVRRVIHNAASIYYL